MAANAVRTQPMVGGPTASWGATASTDRLRRKRSRSEVSGLSSKIWPSQIVLHPPRNGGPTKSTKRQRARQSGNGRLRHRQANDLQHRRGHHHAGEPDPAHRRRFEQHGAAHGMGERIIGRRTIGERDIVHETRDVVLIIGEVPGVTLERILEQPARATLAPPVEHGDGEAPAPELPHHLEIFLYEFGAPRKDTDRAMALLERRWPSGKAQAHAALALEIPYRGSERDGVFRSCDQIHDGTQAWSFGAKRVTVTPLISAEATV